MSKRKEPTFDGINVCGDGDCECGMIWDVEADVHIATAEGPPSMTPTPTEEAQKRWSLILGAAASAAKRVNKQGYDPTFALLAFPDFLDALEVGHYGPSVLQAAARELDHPELSEDLHQMANDFEQALQKARDENNE